MSADLFKNISNSRARKVAEQYSKAGIHLCDMVHSRERRHPDIQKAINKYKAAHAKLSNALKDKKVSELDKGSLEALRTWMIGVLREVMGKGFDA